MSLLFPAAAIYCWYLWLGGHTLPRYRWGEGDSWYPGQPATSKWFLDRDTSWFVRGGAVFAGGHILFVRASTLMAQPFDPKTLKLTGAAVPVAGQVRNSPFYAAFSASANGELVYSTGAEAGNQLTWFDRGTPGGQARRAGTVGEPGQMRDVEFSPDSRRLSLRVIPYRSWRLIFAGLAQYSSLVAFPPDRRNRHASARFATRQAQQRRTVGWFFRVDQSRLIPQYRRSSAFIGGHFPQLTFKIPKTLLDTALDLGI